MYNIYAIVILILFDIRRFPINSLHQFQIAAAPSQDPHWSVVAFVIGRPFRVNWGNLLSFHSFGNLLLIMLLFMSDVMDTTMAEATAFSSRALLLCQDGEPRVHCLLRDRCQDGKQRVLYSLFTLRSLSGRRTTSVLFIACSEIVVTTENHECSVDYLL